MKDLPVLRCLLCTLTATLLAMLASALLGAALQLDASVVAVVWLASAPVCLAVTMLFTWLGRAQRRGRRREAAEFHTLASSSR